MPMVEAGVLWTTHHHQEARARILLRLVEHQKGIINGHGGGRGAVDNAPSSGGTRFFLPTAGFLPLGSCKGSYRGYRGIPLNTARIQISNQNR
jgi:hypothetical protein